MPSPAPFPSRSSSPIDRNPPPCPQTPSSRRPRNTSPSRVSHEDRQVDKFEDCARERNRFFDSKMLSRQHAEVLEEGGKDIQSSNGTFINDEWLSREDTNWTLSSSRTLISLIDIIGEDNKMIIHDQATHHGAVCAAASGIARLGGVGGIGVGGQPPGVIIGLGGMNGVGKPKRSPSDIVPNLPKASAAWVISTSGPLARRA
ncbi:hypothetical protein CVT25_003895 [Psilocybe cyanescens]|uniref:FHA domain-containing protein n=1 Tax=Psilocybe cyanescens TaxID=93625 RepID=A0A409XIW6_PSICY|nr:hypothetical protein CVT25_003895 [Psilocybe cyanescens]